MDAAEEVPAILVRLTAALTNPPFNHAIVCTELTRLVELTEVVSEQVKEELNESEHVKWFDVAVRQLEVFLDPVIEMNPFR